MATTELHAHETAAGSGRGLDGCCAVVKRNVCWWRGRVAGGASVAYLVSRRSGGQPSPSAARAGPVTTARNKAHKCSVDCMLASFLPLAAVSPPQAPAHSRPSFSAQPSAKSCGQTSTPRRPGPRDRAQCDDAIAGLHALQSPSSTAPRPHIPAPSRRPCPPRPVCSCLPAHEHALLACHENDGRVALR